jgi:hypothetical protein
MFKWLRVQATEARGAVACQCGWVQKVQLELEGCLHVVQAVIQVTVA